MNKLQKQRARLVREAAALKTGDGFADDAARQAFDAKMAEIDSIDASLRGSSETIVETPLDPDPAARSASDDDEEEAEPTEIDLAVRSETERIQGIMDAALGARMPQSWVKRMIDEKISLVQAQTRALKELQARGGQDRGPRPGPDGATDVRFGDDPLVHVRSGIENALLHRMHPHIPAQDDAGARVQVVRGRSPVSRHDDPRRGEVLPERARRARVGHVEDGQSRAWRSASAAG
jgi:hypothetical protein